MIRKVCFILFLITTILPQELEVQYEVGRAVFMPPGTTIASGKANLHCRGNKEIKDRIFWSMNGVRMSGQVVGNENETMYHNIYTVTTTNEAYYSCNGVGVYLINNKEEKESEETYVWQGSSITCIDQIAGQGVTKITKTAGLYETEISFIADYTYEMYPVMKDRKVDQDMTVQCNNTKQYTVLVVTKPTTSLGYKSKIVICESDDRKGRCILKIYFGDTLKAEGYSPLKYKYGNIYIKDVFCEAECTIGEDSIVLPVQNIEINRALYICVIFAIILIILISMISSGSVVYVCWRYTDIRPTCDLKRVSWIRTLQKQIRK